MGDLMRIFPGHSEMARRMRALDWCRTELGAPEAWPVNLRVALAVCLTSNFPMHLCWGRSLTLFYNDAYIPLLGPVKHPAVLGRSGREAWAEIWETIGPMIDRVFNDGIASWAEDTLMFFDRELTQEEVYVTFSFSPVFGDEGTVDGMFCACTETTEKIVGSRRLDTLRKLGVEAAVMRNVADACTAAAGVLGTNPYDVPFAALYLLNEKEGLVRASLTGGISDTAARLPASVPISDEQNSPWPFAATLETKSAVDVALDTFDFRILGGPWSEPLRQAVVLPIRAAAHEQLTGLLVAGVSTRRRLDGDYRTFFDLVAGHIATALADAHAREEAGVTSRGRILVAELARVRRAAENALAAANTSLEAEVCERRAAEDQIKALFRRLVTTQEEERQRIARDIHDQVGQQITALRMNLEAVRSRLGVEPSLIEQVERMQRLAEELDRSIDFLTWELRPAALDHLGLPAALHSLVSGWSERFGIAAEFEASGTDGLRLASNVEANLYRLAQEALHNVLKHSGASHVSVFLEHLGDRVVLVIEDNGRGFRPADGRPSGHLGLVSMRERATLVGGEFDVESAPGEGTSVLIRVPVGHGATPTSRGVE